MTCIGFLVKRSVIVFVCVIACSLLCGCNEYHRTVHVDVDFEVKSSKETAETKKGRIHVPAGWQLHSLTEAADKPFVWVTLEKHDSRGKVGNLDFQSIDSPPSWFGTSGERKTSTARHKDLSFTVLSKQRASGDDTPARYVLEVYVKSKQSNWQMTASFFAPVEPDFERVVGYADAID